MKGLASALLLAGIVQLVGLAGPLEMSIGGGPSVVSLDTVHDAIGVFNSLITHLNETFAVHPDVTGEIDLVSPMRDALYLHAAERYWITDGFALGGHVGYLRSATGTRGTYEGTESSEIRVELDLHSVSGMLTAEANILDIGLRLGGYGGIGYHYVMIDRATVFEIPEEFPDVIVGVPPNGEGRYSGGSLGFEFGITLSYPVSPGFLIGSRVSYRTARVAEMVDPSGSALDLDGNGVPESISLNGITVQLTLSVHIDLSLGGRKE